MSSYPPSDLPGYDDPSLPDCADEGVVLEYTPISAEDTAIMLKLNAARFAVHAADDRIVTPTHTWTDDGSLYGAYFPPLNEDEVL